MRTYLAPLACLALNLRNAAARMLADAAPVADYDGPETHGDGLDVAPNAYAVMGPNGFGMFGANRDPQLGACDPYTGATGFGPDGEATGLREEGTATTFDAECELDTARQTLEYLEDFRSDSALNETDAEEFERCTALVDSLGYADGGPSDGMVSTEDMNVPYWTECANSHLAEMDAAERTMANGYRFPTPMAIAARANVDAADGRIARLERLRKRLQAGVVAYRKAHRSGKQGAGQAVLNDIGGLVAMVESDFKADQAHAKSTGDYTGLVLTAGQMEDFRRFVRVTKRQVEVIRAQTRPGQVEATPAILAAMATDLARLQGRRA